MLWFIVGLFLGIIIGGMAIALCSASKMDEMHREYMRRIHGSGGDQTEFSAIEEQKGAD